MKRNHLVNIFLLICLFMIPISCGSPANDAPDMLPVVDLTQSIIGSIPYDTPVFMSADLTGNPVGKVADLLNPVASTNGTVVMVSFTTNTGSSVMVYADITKLVALESAGFSLASFLPGAGFYLMLLLCGGVFGYLIFGVVARYQLPDRRELRVKILSKDNFEATITFTFKIVPQLSSIGLTKLQAFPGISLRAKVENAYHSIEEDAKASITTALASVSILDVNEKASSPDFLEKLGRELHQSGAEVGLSLSDPAIMSVDLDSLAESFASNAGSISALRKVLAGNGQDLTHSEFTELLKAIGTYNLPSALSAGGSVSQPAILVSDMTAQAGVKEKEANSES